MKAVILAAGKGTRMKELTKDIPKPMMPVHGKPLLEYLVRFIKGAGITDFGFVVGYKRSVIEDYFGNGSSFGVSVTYIDQKEQNGTGAALHLAKNFAAGEPFFFSFGDVITPAENYPKMFDSWRKHLCDALLGLNIVDDPSRGAAVYMNDDRTILRMVEKPAPGTSTTNLHNAGIMILPGDTFDYTERIPLSPRGEYELTDVFNLMRVDNLLLKGYVLSGYWKDVGTPDDLEAVHALLE